MIAAQASDSQATEAPADRFWPAATRTTVALAVAAGAARSAGGSGDNCARIVQLCAELSALAGDADGALVGAIAESLGSFVGSATLDEPALEVVAGHLEALRAVVRHSIGGDGGPVGRAIMAGLNASVARHGAAA